MSRMRRMSKMIVYEVVNKTTNGVVAYTQSEKLPKEYNPNSYKLREHQEQAQEFYEDAEHVMMES